jgi:hypothetical protein
VPSFLDLLFISLRSLSFVSPVFFLFLCKMICDHQRREVNDSVRETCICVFPFPYFVCLAMERDRTTPATLFFVSFLYLPLSPYVCPLPSFSRPSFTAHVGQLYALRYRFSF